MAVVSVNKTNNRTGTERSLLLNEIYRVVLDDANTPLSEIVNHPDMPQFGFPHPEFDYLFCLTRNPRQEQDARLVVDFDVEFGQITYTDEAIANVLAGGDPLTLTQPENRAPVYAWKTVEETQPLRYHRCSTRNGEVRQGDTVLSQITPGNRIRNTAEIPFTDQGTYRAFKRVLTVQRFQSAYSEDEALSYLYHANSVPFLNKEEYTVVCTLFDAETVYVPQSGDGAPRLLYLVNQQFEYDPDGQWQDWDNVSAMELVSNELSWVVDAGGEKVAHPVFLDEAGAAIDPPSVEANETYIRIFPYEETDLSVLVPGAQ